MAVGLVGLAILTLVGVYVGGLKLAAQSQDHTAAIDLARQTLEEIRDLPWDQLPAEGVTPYPPRGQFAVLVETTDRGQLKIITVRIRWAKAREAHLATMLSKP